MDKSCLFLDVDGTVFRWQLFHELIVEMVEQGLMPRIVLTHADEALREYRERIAPFRDFVHAQVDAYQGDGRMQGIRVNDMKFTAREVIRKRGNRIHVFPRELIATATEAGYLTAIISGSPMQVVEELATHLGIDIAMGTEHPYENGRFTGGKPKEWVIDKAEALKLLVERHNISLKESIMVGDSESDAPILDRVGYPICFNPNQELWNLACRKNRHWPVVVERKAVYFLAWYHHAQNYIHSVPNPILPAPLGAKIENRLKELDLFLPPRLE